MKEIKLRPRIANHDLATKIKHVRRLLAKDRVKVSVIFRGREVTHLELGLNLLDRVVDETKDISRVEARSGKDKVYFVVLVSDGKENRETLLKIQH